MYRKWMKYNDKMKNKLVILMRVYEILRKEEKEGGNGMVNKHWDG